MNLSKRSAAAKKRILEANDISAEGVLVLDSALAYFDRHQRANKGLAKQGLTTKSKTGTVAHPLVAVSDAAYKNFLAGFRYLNLSVEAVMPDAKT